MDRLLRRHVRQYGLEATLGLRSGKGEVMLDVVFLAITVAFFAIALAYASACDRGIGAA